METLTLEMNKLTYATVLMKVIEVEKLLDLHVYTECSVNVC